MWRNKTGCSDEFSAFHDCFQVFWNISNFKVGFKILMARFLNWVSFTGESVFDVIFEIYRDGPTVEKLQIDG
jgi:hypothetical protein